MQCDDKAIISHVLIPCAFRVVIEGVAEALYVIAPMMFFDQIQVWNVLLYCCHNL